MSLFSGKMHKWSTLVKVKSSLMKSPGLTGNSVTASDIISRKVAGVCCPEKDVIMNNGGVILTHPNKTGGVADCPCPEL